jgi:hypothetical protein
MPLNLAQLPEAQGIKSPAKRRAKKQLRSTQVRTRPVGRSFLMTAVNPRAAARKQPNTIPRRSPSGSIAGGWPPVLCHGMKGPMINPMIGLRKELMPKKCSSMIQARRLSMIQARRLLGDGFIGGGHSPEFTSLRDFSALWIPSDPPRSATCRQCVRRGASHRSNKRRQPNTVSF